MNRKDEPRNARNGFGDLAPHLAEITDKVISDLQQVSDIYLEEGVLTRAVDVSQGFDPSFNAARAEQPDKAVAQAQPQ